MKTLHIYVGTQSYVQIMLQHNIHSTLIVFQQYIIFVCTRWLIPFYILHQNSWYITDDFLTERQNLVARIPPNAGVIDMIVKQFQCPKIDLQVCFFSYVKCV